jgi:alpha-tubulin suppressor-like RCC1 family protein
MAPLTAVSTYCGGNNRSGQLGNGTTTSSTTPVEVAGGHHFVQVSPNGWSPETSFTCGLTNTGAILCWGAEQGCVLGRGSCAVGQLHTIPLPVQSSETFAALTTGNGFACGLTTAASTVCWGTNWFGSLGVGHNGDLHGAWTTDAAAGIPVRNLAPPLKHLSAQGGSTCGIDANGDVHCWGDVLWDLLGGGRTGFALSPRQVAGAVRFR